MKHPDWHPTDDVLVAEGNCRDGNDLFLIDLSTHSVRLLWDDEATAGYPRWFADGTRIAFHQIDADRVARLFMASLDQAHDVLSTRRLTDGPFDIEPAPSPAGRTLAFSRPGESGLDIALLDLGSAAVTRFWATPSAENFPSWTADGGRIIFHARDEDGTQIYSRDRNTGQLRQLTEDPGPNIVANLSRDGRFLAYSSERSGDREIYLRNLVDGSERRITNRPGRDGYPKLSPDGTQLAYHAVIGAQLTVVRVLTLATGDVLEFSCESASFVAVDESPSRTQPQAARTEDSPPFPALDTDLARIRRNPGGELTAQRTALVQTKFGKDGT